MKLLRSQKNEIYHVIENSNLFEPVHFEIKENPSETKIVLTNSEFFFTFHATTNYPFLIEFSPSQQSVSSMRVCKDWSETMYALGEWLILLEREVSAPDLWSRLTENLQLANITNNQTYSEFTVSEYEDLRQRINTLNTQLTVLPFLVESQSSIQATLIHIEELAQKLSKFDWTNLFIGTIISIIVQLNVTPDNAKALWDLIKNIFAGYLIQLN